MKLKIMIATLICFSLSTSTLVYADNSTFKTTNGNDATTPISLFNEEEFKNELNTNLINKDMLDSEGNLIIPEIEIPDDLPDFNVSLREKYNNALGELKLQGFEVNNTIPTTSHNYTSDIEFYFYQQFPDTKLTTEEEIDTLMYQFTSAFDEIYNADKEELPSKEATLIWDMNSVLNGATKPQGYADALKETNKNIGSANTSLKNEISNKIENTHSNINPNAKPTTPSTPSSPSATKPSKPTATKPSSPTSNIDLTTPTLKKPTADTVGIDDVSKHISNAILGEKTTNSIINAGSNILDKAESGWDKIVEKAESGWNKITSIFKK